MLIGLPYRFLNTMLRMLSILIAISASFSLDHLVMTNGFTKSDTLVGIAGGIFKGTLGKAGAARGVDQALHLKDYTSH